MKLINTPVMIHNGQPVNCQTDMQANREKTISYQILNDHCLSRDEIMHIRFDSLTSHDITYVGIIQTARASGMKKFPMPYVLTNCHNTLCAVGGTINEDDHQFALSAARKYGGIYVPPCYAVIHSYNREMMSGCGRMILGSDSHTRYGALGTMGVGEGGGELAKQLVNRTYDLADPEVVLIWLKGKPKPGVGPHDVALALVAATYANGFVKNKVMEFAGPGLKNLSQDFRNGIDVMTTETTCWSSIWETDETTEKYYENHGRKEDYKKLSVREGAKYNEIREKIVEKALSCVGNPYVWGGTSLTRGADCSGFVQTLYKMFGYSLPRVAAAQSGVGTQIPVSDAAPGDLIFFARNGYIYHVAMYAGDGKTVEAYSTQYGIITKELTERNAVWATRIIED